jgi:hypothetical protein
VTGAPRISAPLYAALLLCVTLSFTAGAQQRRFLFDATKAEMAGNADWVIDTDTRNLGVNSSHLMQAGQGNESNPQRIPSPAASAISATTPETFWSGAISAWGVELVRRGCSVETLPYNGTISFGNGANAQDLSSYDVFVVCEPNIPFTAAEKTAILQFVQNGGGLFMIGDHDQSDRNGDGWDSPHIWNDLMQNNSVQQNPFGMTFSYDDISVTTYAVDTAPSDSVTHGPAGSALACKFSNGATMTLSTAANPSVLGAVWSQSTPSMSNVMCAWARFGNGKVVAIGDSSPFDDGTGDPNDNLYNGWTEVSGNHAKLCINASMWLSQPGVFVPVDLLAFHAAYRPADRSVEFAWTTAREDGNLGFTLQEYDATRQAFLDLDGSFVPALRDAVAGGSYRWTLRDVSPGAHEFRLRQMDFDGKTQTFPPVRIDAGNVDGSVPPDPAIVIAPEPFHDATSVTLTLDAAAEVGIAIFDARGHRVATMHEGVLGKGTHALRWNAAANAPGAYYARITIDGVATMRRLVRL